MVDEDSGFRVRSSYERTLDPGETVFDQGDPGDRLYVIQSGEIELLREDPEGRRLVAHLGPGDFFGELAVVSGQRRTTRAVAATRARVLELDRETLEGMCLAQPEIAIRMIRILAARLVEAERRLSLLGVDDLLRPVVRTLLRAAEPVGEGAKEHRVETNLRGVAEGSGLSMREAHRALHQLFDRSVVHLLDDVLVVPDLEALSDCLDEPPAPVAE